jgi:hypothetical protein
VIAGRRDGESIADLLTRVYDEMRVDYLADGVGGQNRELMETYVHIVMSVPALQAKALHRAFALQKDIAAALVNVYPDELDPISAAAIVGAMVGATQGAALASLERGDTNEEFWAAMSRGLDIALRGLRTY